jgi:hypothetical protein
MFGGATLRSHCPWIDGGAAVRTMSGKSAESQSAQMEHEVLKGMRGTKILSGLPHPASPAIVALRYFEPI